MPKKKNTTRGDGRISVQVYLGRDEGGKRKYKTVYGSTQKEADEKALQIKLAMRKGIDIAAERDTFEDWAKRWLHIKATEVSNGQLVAYRCALKHINGYVGDVPISKLKTADLQCVILDLADENPTTGNPTAKQTLKVVKAAMSQVYQLAIENRVLDYNAAQAVKIPANAPSTTKRALSEDEQAWIRETPHRAQRAAMIMMYSGLRRGKLIPLMWNDIDLVNHTIRVNKSVELLNGKYVIKNRAKTYAGLRIVDIPDVLVEFLKNEPRANVYVCNSARNEMHTGSSWSRMWSSYLLDLNIKYGHFLKRPKSKFDPNGIPFMIPHFTPHWFRHTFATMLYLAGYDIKDAMEQLGHADAKTTINIYTHLDAQHKRKSMAKLNDFLGACKSDASQGFRRGLET